MLPPATWYPDPSGRHEHRYWDGERWTEHVADAGIADIDPLNAVTADEQVDGGLAADIAAVAMASTSTVGDDVPEPDGGPSAWTEPPRHEDSAAGGDPHDTAGVESVELDDHMDGDADVDTGSDGHVDTGSDAMGDARSPGSTDERDAWAAASAMFVMPPDTVAALRAGASDFWDEAADEVHAEVDEPADVHDVHDVHDEADEADEGDQAEGGASSFVVLGDDRAADGGEPDAVLPATVGHGGADVRVVIGDEEASIVRLASLGQVDGSVRFDEAVPDWGRRTGGTGTALLRCRHGAMMLAAPGQDGVTLAVDALLAVDGAACLDPVDGGEIDRTLVRVAGASWLAVDVGPDASFIEVAGVQVVDRRRVVAWTDGVEVTHVGDGQLGLDGTGQLLVRSRGTD